MLETTLMDIKRLFNSSSNVDVSCGGHHNHVIHPVRQDSANDDAYGDFWGESALDSGPPSGEPLERRDSSGGLFANVVRKPSILFTDAKRVGLQLSFDESVESGTSGASERRTKKAMQIIPSSGSDSDDSA